MLPKFKKLKLKLKLKKAGSFEGACIGGTIVQEGRGNAEIFISKVALVRLKRLLTGFKNRPATDSLGPESFTGLTIF
ncbi:MAG: hypothetical protein D6714_09210 [Bacteroidetes bacterium]|nr:MAG: hypothetical protein D6714_09210 [Bacteroidota bacterium]